MLMTEAAELARQAQPRRHWLTHYSPAMRDVGEWLPFAKAIFPATEPGVDGMSVDLMYTDEPNPLESCAL
jgi:ribonuclease Z